MTDETPDTTSQNVTDDVSHSKPSVIQEAEEFHEDEIYDPSAGQGEEDSPPPPTYDVLLQSAHPSLSTVRESVLRMIAEMGGGTTNDAFVEGQRLFGIRAEKPGTIEHSLAILENYLTDEATRAANYLKSRPELTTDKDFSRRLVKEPGRPSTLGPVGLSPKALANPEVSGDEGITNFESSRRGNVSNVMLFNSGISISLRQPKVVEIYNLVARCRALYSEWGGYLGASYYLMDDYLIKTQILQFVMPLIVDSSLKDYQHEGMLYKAISLNDLQHILMEIAVLMYPKGYKDFITVCPPSVEGMPKAGCGKVQKHEIDLRTLIRTRFSSLSRDSVQFMTATRDTKKRRSTLEDVLHYQEKLGFNSKIYLDDLVFHFSPPTLETYFASSEKLFSDTLLDIQAVDKKDQGGVIASRVFSFYLPWVSRVDRIEVDPTGKEDPKVVITTTDRKVVVHMLNSLMDDPEKAKEATATITKIIDESVLTHICHEAETCSCGYKNPENGGFVAVDPRSAFFTMGEAKLPDIY